MTNDLNGLKYMPESDTVVFNSLDRYAAALFAT